MAKFGGWGATKIFISALILMQMSDDFPIQTRRCDALRMINLDTPQMALQGDTIELSCSYSLITTTSSSSSSSSSPSSSSPSLQPQDNHRIANRFMVSKQVPATTTTSTSNSDINLSGDSSIDKLSRSFASGRLGANELGVKRGVAGAGGAVIATNSGEAQLELVYAIKWYKDEREFFRFLGQDWPHKQAFPLDGLNIDVDKSDNQTVVLKNVSLKTSGLFRCEVSTEAPSFLTKSIARKVFIYSLPNDGPTIEQPLKRTNQVRHLGEQLNFACSSRESKPATQIDWIINETLNLSSIKSLPATKSGAPLFQIRTRRVIRLPTTMDNLPRQPLPVRPASSAQVQYQSFETGLDRVAQQLQRRDANLDSTLIAVTPQQKPHISFTNYELDDSIWPPAAKPLDNPNSMAPISLGTNSLHQLLETTKSWLNFSVDTDLLQYLSSVGALPQWPTTDVKWSARKTVGATSNGYLTPLNQSLAQGNSFSSKTRRNNTTGTGLFAGGAGAGLGGQKRSSSQQHQSGLVQGVAFSVRVRCVARVLHLSMSDDIKLKIVNKTKESAAQELALTDTRGRKNSSGPMLSIMFKSPVYYAILLATIQLMLSQLSSRTGLLATSYV